MQSSMILRKTAWLSLAIFLALAVFLGLRIAGNLALLPPEGAPDFARGKLEFQLANGTRIPFDVEIADTQQKASYGLMFRRVLPHDAGMIFVQPEDYIATFWMQNTLIPLDMLFVRSDGTIARIVTDTKPLDLTPIRSGVPVRAVVEINGGEAAKRGIHEGDKVIFPGLGAP